MAYDDIINKYKKHLTKAQIKALADMEQKYRNLYSQQRAQALNEMTAQGNSMQRALQNMGLAGRHGKLISGVQKAGNERLTRSYGDYHTQLGRAQNAQLERAAIRMANQTIAAQNAAAEAEYKRKLAEYERLLAEQKRQQQEYNDNFTDPRLTTNMTAPEKAALANAIKHPQYDPDQMTDPRMGNMTAPQKAQLAKSMKQYTVTGETDPRQAYISGTKNPSDMRYRSAATRYANKTAEIEQKTAKWDEAINQEYSPRDSVGKMKKQTAINEMAKAYSQRNRAYAAAMNPAVSELIMMNDDQFAVSFDAAERLYNQQLQKAAILRKDSPESMDDLSSDAAQIEAQAHREWSKWEQAKRAREDTGEVASLSYTIPVSESDKTRYKDGEDMPYFVYDNQRKWQAIPWANKQEWNGNNWKKAEAKGWNATDYAKSHDTKGSVYAALVNEWAYINGRTALLYTQTFQQTQEILNIKDFFSGNITRNTAHDDFIVNCLSAFHNREYGFTKAEQEQMDAMLTLANLMTDEERARFNGMLKTYGTKYADEYFEYLYNDVLPQRFMQYTQDEMAFDTRLGIDRVGESLASVPNNIMQGWTGVAHTIGTRQNDPVAAQLGAAKYNTAQSMRGAVGANYGEWGNRAYQTVMSMADSATVAAISGGIGSVVEGFGVGAELAGKIGSALGGSILGASAFNSTYDEALQRGLSPDKARWTAFGNGVNEMLFETLSIGTLLEKTGKSAIKVSKDAWKNVVVNTLVQAGVEGSEEVFTDIANKIWDDKLNGIYSEELQKVREYVDAGYTYDQARDKVKREYAEQLGLSFLGGAVSGGFMGGGAGAMHNFQNRYFEKRGAQMDASVKSEIDNFKFTDKQAQELQQQSKKTNMDYGMLEAMMYQQMFAEGKAYVQKAFSDGTITQEQKDLYEKYAKLAAEKKLTNEMIEDEQVAQDMEKLEPVFDIMEEGEMIKNGMRDLAEAQRAVRDENAKYDKQVAAIENDTTLTDEQKQQKIDAIENERGEKVVEKVRDLEKLQKKYDENVKAENGKVETKRGNLTYDFSTSNKANTFDKMSDRQKSALRFAKLFADKYGMNIKVVDDTVAGESEDGHYNHDTDTITINISGANSVMYTVSHEVTHWLQEHNSKAYKTLKSAIEKELSRTDLIVSELPKSYQRVMGDYKTADNTVMDALVKYEQDMYKRQMNKALSKERAEDEVVARCCESFLKDRGFAQKMVAENPGTARTIAAKLRQLANDMKTLNEDALERGYEKYGDLIDSSIEKAALEQIGDIEKIARMWENALNRAAKKAAKTKAPKAEVQHSFNNKLSDVDSPVVNRIADSTFPIQPPTIKGADAMQKSVPSATKNALLDVQDSMFHPSQYSRNYAPQIQQRNAEYVMSKVNDDGTVKTDKHGNPLLRYPAWAYTRTGEKIVELAKRITKLYENETDSHGNRLLPEETILSNNIFENASYLLDAEPTTECFRQTIYRAFLKQVTDKLGRPVTEREAIIVNQACIEIGIDAPCIYCYSLLDRKAKEAYKLQYLAERDAFFKALDKEYGDDIERFRKDRAEGEQTTEVDKKTQEEHTVWTKPYMLYLSRITDPAAYKDGKYQKSMARDGNWSKADRVNLWLDVWENSYKNGTLVSAKDVRNIEADKESLKAAEGNELRTRELQDVIGWSQDASQAKVIVPYSAYTNEGSGSILSWSQDKIDKLNSEYGLRWYSHADFHPAFIVDNMQQILDASAKGLKGLMYLKPTEAAEIYAPTGMLINLSCFAQYKDGQYVVDDRLGADWETVQRLRKQYKNVGAVMVVTSDDMWMWAMTQDWVDVIIPLHLVRSGRDFVDAFGLQNYSKEQADALVGADAKKKYEAYIEAKAKEQDIELNSKNRKELEKANKSVYPSEHENDYTKYMEACKKRGLTPRFDRMRQIVEKGASYNGKKITLDDYMKCVNETRMPYTKAQPLQPKFNFAAAERAAAQLKQKGFFDYFKPSSEWNGKTMKVGDWVNQAYNDILAKKEPSKLGYGRDLAIDKNGKYIEVRSSEEARQRGVGGAHDNVQHSFNDKEYLALASKVEDGTATDADKAELRKQVDAAAKAAGYRIKAYHGTYRFGRTKFTSQYGALFLSSNPDVGQAFSGDQPVRAISKQANPDTMDIDEAARWYKQNVHSGEFRVATDADFKHEIERLQPLPESVRQKYHLSEEDVAWQDKALKKVESKYSRFLNGEKFYYFEYNGINHDYANSPFADVNDFRNVVRERLVKNDNGGGVYEMYISPKKMITVNANGSYYSNIPLPWNLFDYATDDEIRRGTVTSDQLVRIAHNAGYDTLKIKDVFEGGDYGRTAKATDYVVMNPESQAKSADIITKDDNGNIIPLSERFKTDRTGEDAWKNEDIRYSMNNKVERVGDLIAVHNLSGDQLLKSVELGGFPMPSIAVMKQTQGHERYGDVSVIFGKDTIDPKKSSANKVYGGDAWTPTYPTVEYKPRKTVADRIAKTYFKIANEYGYDAARPLYKYIYELERQLNNAGSEKALLDDLYNDVDIMRMYGQINGKERVEDVYQEKRTEMDESDRAIPEYFIKTLGEDFVKEFGNTSGRAAFEYKKQFVKDHIKEIERALGDYMRQQNIDLEQASYVLENMTTRDYMVSLQRALNIINNNAVKVERIYDRAATEQAIKNSIDEKAYKEWIYDLFHGIIEKSGIRNNKGYYTDSGNQRSWDSLHEDETLENVVRVMRDMTDKGSNAFFSQSEMLALGTRNFKSISEIREHKDQLQHISDEEMSEAKTNIVNQFGDLMEEMRDKRESNYFIGRDRALQAMVEAVRRSRTPQGILNELKQWHGLNVTDDMGRRIADLLDEIADLPTEYFEAKPRRAVGLDEIKAVIMPQGEYAELKEKLDERGIPVVEYEKDNTEDRLRALNSDEVSKQRFSLNDKEYLALASKVKDGTATDADKAELRKAVDAAAERWGAITNDVDSNPETGEPEKSLYFYHGSTSDHTVFKGEMAGKNGSAQGRGFYFSTDEIFANRYAINEKGFGKMYKAFLKAENPIRSREHRISREERRQILLEMDRKEMDGRGYTYSVLEDIFPVTIDSDETYNHFVDEYMDFTEEWDDAQFYARLSTHMNIDAATSTMLEHGYDASIMEKRDKSQAIVVVFTPQQIKSADLVTYDKDGNIIPLSERFKTDRTGEHAWKNEDIRYSMNDKDFVLKKNNGEKWYELRDVKAHLFGSSVELDGGSLLNRVRMMQNLAEVYGSVTVDATSEKEAEAFKRAGAQREADTFGDTEYGTWVFEHQENKYEKDTQFDAKQKRNFADAVLKEIGTRKNFTKDQLLRFRAGLEKAFAALHNATFGDGDAMVAYEYADKLFDRMLDAYTEMPEDASMLRDTILNALRRTTDGKGRIVRELDVTKTQMSEIRNAFENVADFNRALSKALGTRVFVKEVENATMLENLFTHSQDTRFDKTTNEGDMPSELMRLAQETVVDRVNKYKAESDERMAMKEALWDKATEIVGAEKTAAQKVREAVKQVRAEERAKAKTKTQEEVAKARLAERMHEGAIRAKERRASAERESNIKRDAAKREAKLKDVTKQKLEQQKLNTLRRDVKTIALKWNQRLVKMLANPTEASHIPVQLAREVAAFTDALTRYLDSGTQRGQINLEKIAKAYQQAFDDQETIAQAKAENRKYDPRGAVLDREMFDEQLVGMINELNTILQGKTLKDLDAFEMRMLLNTVRGVAHTVYEANRMIGTSERKAIWQVGDQMVKELESAPKIKGDFARFFLEESLDLRRIAKVFSGSNENAEFVKLSDMLNRGAIEKERVAQVLSGMFDPLTQQYGEEIRKWYGKNAEWIDTGITKNGRKVEITKGMRVSLAMHVLNAGNMRHIENGGVTIPNRELYAKGKLADAYANGTLVRLNADQINTIISQMTEAEKAYVEVAKEFFHQRTGYYVNKTSLQLLGYRKATVENYFPIHTDRNYTKSDFASVVRDGSIEGQGFLKERVMASNPVYLEDITSVVNRQIKGVSLYAGLAVPMRNFNAVMNASVYEDENGNWVPRTTVRKAMTQSMGEYGTKVVQGFLQDVSGMSAVDVTPGEQRVAKLQTRYVKAVLLANLKVTLKQAASYPTAAAVIPWKYLSKALLKGGRNQRLISRADVDLINQYTPLYKMRRDGMANEITSIMAERGLEQKMPWLLGWITKMDVATVGRLWSAAEYMVADQQNLPVGSDEYYKAVAEVFNQTIQQTQPNFTPLQRNAALRSKNPVIRTLTLFGTQRMQNGGILIESAMELKHAKTDAQKQAARVKFGRAVASQIVQNLMLIAIGFAVDALRGRMTGWRDEDKELNAKSIFGNVLDQFMGNIFGSFLGGSEAYAQTIGKWMRKAMNLPTYKTKFTVPALASLEEILDFANDVEGLPDYLMNHDASENKKKLLSFTKKLAKVGGYVTGFPFENMTKDLIDGLNPALQDIIGASNTGELIPWLHNSGKLDSAKTAANYKEWTNLGKKGSTYLYWENIAKQIKGDSDLPNGDTLAMRLSASDLTPEERATIYRMLMGSDYIQEGDKVYNKVAVNQVLKAGKGGEPEPAHGNIVVDFSSKYALQMSLRGETKYEAFRNAVADGVSEKTVYNAFVKYETSKKNEIRTGKDKDDAFRDWLFKDVSDPHERAVLDKTVVGKAKSVEGSIGYKSNGEVYADYSSRDLFDTYLLGKKADKAEAVNQSAETPEAKAQAFASMNQGYTAKDGIVYNDKGVVQADFTSDEAYRASQMGESHYAKYTDAVKQGMSKENAILAVEKHKEFTDDDDKDNATQYATWVFNTYKNAKDRAIAGAIYTTKSVTIKDGRTYDENGYIYRDYTSAAWYKLSNRTLSKDGKNKRYEAAKLLEKDGYTAEKTVAAYVELDKLSKKSEWQKWLKDHGYTNDQINIILWSRGWAKID